MLGEGKDNQQIIDFMVDRYGDFVRYKPALTGKTALLWFGPAGLLLAGVVVMAVIVRRRRAAPTDGSDALSPEERQRLDQLLVVLALPQHAENFFAQVGGDRGVGVGNVLVLALGAAQFLGQFAKTLAVTVLGELVGVDGRMGNANQSKCQNSGG